MPEATDTKDGGAPSGTAAAAAPTTQQAAAGAPTGGTGGASGGASKDDGGKGDGGKAEGGEGEGDPKTVTIGDDEYPVDAKGFLSISVQTFKRRLNRYSAKQLKDTFGTDNVDDIKSRLDEHGKLKAQSEEQRRKQLAKEEQLAEDLKKERDRADKAQARADQLAEEREYREADQDVRKVAERYVEPGKFSKLAMVEFAEYVRDLDEDEVSKLKDKDVEAWFKQYADDNPKLAKGAKPGKGEDDDKSKVRRPIEHGAGAAGADPKATPQEGAKTPKPGTPTTMTDAEYKAHKLSRNIRA